MMFAVRFFELGDGEMQVTLGGGQGAMTEDLLDVTDIGFVLQQVRGATVSPHVAGDTLFDPGAPCVFPDQSPERKTGRVDGTDLPLSFILMAVATLEKFPELKKLPKRQRFQLAEELWLSGINDSLPVSSAQKKLLDTRWAAYKSGAAKRIALVELERRVSRK
jgi:putative addiction module component (TIGR02574 family)